MKFAAKFFRFTKGILAFKNIFSCFKRPCTALHAALFFHNPARRRLYFLPAAANAAILIFFLLLALHLPKAPVNLGLLLQENEPAPVWVPDLPLEEAVCPGEVIRFHVRAHDNSPVEQNIKNFLAQKTIHLYGSRWGNCANREELHSILARDQKELEFMACQTLAQKGFPHDVRVSLAKGFFPARLYEGRLYPPGEYEALNMVIGAGSGENWWCVLFPPLCFNAVPRPADEEKGFPPTVEKGEGFTADLKDNEKRVEKSAGVAKPVCRFWLLEWLRKFRQRSDKGALTENPRLHATGYVLKGRLYQ